MGAQLIQIRPMSASRHKRSFADLIMEYKNPPLTNRGHWSSQGFIDTLIQAGDRAEGWRMSEQRKRWNLQRAYEFIKAHRHDVRDQDDVRRFGDQPRRLLYLAA